jgi:hypothetical protein
MTAETAATPAPMTIEDLAALIGQQVRERLIRDHGQEAGAELAGFKSRTMEVIHGKKYAKVNRGLGHGFLMVEYATRRIYGIRGYGQVNKAACYGTLDEARGWYWGEDDRPEPVAEYEARQKG